MKLKDYDLPIVEPIIIHYKSDGSSGNPSDFSSDWRVWNHPDINRIVTKKGYETDSPGCTTGNMMRIKFGNTADKKYGYMGVLVVVDIDEDHYNRMIDGYNKELDEKNSKWANMAAGSIPLGESEPTSKTWQDIWRNSVDMAWIALREDVWFPGGEQFCTTDVYKEIGRLDYSDFSSVDLCIGESTHGFWEMTGS